MNSRPFVARYNPMPPVRRSGSFLPAAIVRPLMAPRPPVVRYATQPPLVRQTYSPTASSLSNVTRKRRSDQAGNESDPASKVSKMFVTGSRSSNSDDTESHKSPKRMVRIVTNPQGRQIPSPPQQSPASKFKEDDKVSVYIINYLQENRQRQDLYTQKMRLRDMIYSLIKEVFPQSGLYVVGSSVNGFGSNESDMDLCLMLSSDEISREQSVQILYILKSTFRKCHFLDNLIVINAKVPILKFSDKPLGVSCDVNVNNSVGIRNTHLLNAYAKIDPRIVPLVLFVKHWAKSQGINDASQGTISSYSFVLMTLHYLQCGCTPSVIPCLQTTHPHLFAAETDIRHLSLNLSESVLSYRSSNLQSVGDLFLGFLRYYSQDFDFDTDVVSVRLGRKLRRQDVTRSYRGYLCDEWKFICIEEPFNQTNTARAVYDVNNYERIRRVFKQSYITLRQNGDVQTILNRPF